MTTERRIGATDIACLLGIDPYRTAEDVMNRIVHGRDAEITPPMLRGQKTEPRIRARGAELHGLTIYPRDLSKPFVVQSEKYRFATASPDDYASLNGQEGLAEYKSVTRWSAKKWGVEDTDSIPEHYLCQCHWQMAVTGRSPVWLVAAFGEDIKGQDKQPTGDFDIIWSTRYIVQRDRELENYLLSVGELFWNKHVLTGIPPGENWIHSEAA